MSICPYCHQTTRQKRHGKSPAGKQYYKCLHCNRHHTEGVVPVEIDWTKRTLGEMQQAAKYQVNAVLRNMARRAFRNSDRQQICQNCGYGLHVEICHIQAINSFPLETPVAVVNGLDNLMALCPNCHWELDHGMLTVEEILRVK